MSASELFEELKRTLLSINTQIGYVRKEAQRQHISAYAIQDTNGNFMLAPLLVAKANVLHSIVTLKG